VIWWPDHRRAKIRAEGARKRPAEAIREADRAEAEALVDPDGRLWRAPSALAYHRPMPQRRIWLVEVECHPCKTRASIPL
jgi:hypothetical protein